MSKLKVFVEKECCLTHYQTTNFRLFQTERVCRRQFQIWRKWKKVIQTDRKHCGKRRNCSLRKACFPGVSKGAIVWEWVNSLPHDKILDWSKFKAFANDKVIVTQNLKLSLGRVENIVGKLENAGYEHFCPFPTMFSKAFLSRGVKSLDCLAKG